MLLLNTLVKLSYMQRTDSKNANKIIMQFKRNLRNKDTR